MRKRINKPVLNEFKINTGDADLHVVEVPVLKCKHRRATIIPFMRSVLRRRFEGNLSDLETIARYADVTVNTVLQALRGWSLDYTICKRIIDAFRIYADQLQIPLTLRDY